MAKKSDKIDVVLGDFINMHPESEKIQTMFIRESKGVYQFGQKCIQVKLDKANQILVRVGSGYMHIDQFIQQFTTSLEVDKIQKLNSSFVGFGNKSQMQQSSDLITNGEIEVEVTPIKDMQRPQLLAKSKS